MIQNSFKTIKKLTIVIDFSGYTNKASVHNNNKNKYIFLVRQILHHDIHFAISPRHIIWAHQNISNFESLNLTEL